jgi:hypothetical protein
MRQHEYRCAVDGMVSTPAVRDVVRFALLFRRLYFRRRARLAERFSRGLAMVVAISECASP